MLLVEVAVIALSSLCAMRHRAIDAVVMLLCFKICTHLLRDRGTAYIGVEP